MEALSQKFLHYIASKNNISMKNAIKKVDNCFKSVSLEMGIETSKVIRAFYEYLNPGYDKYCALLDPEECVDSLYCTPFENQCIPIYVKDYDLINKDPDSYINKIRTEELKRLRDVAAHLYYNVGDSGIEDNSYDAIEWNLRQRLKKEYDKEIKLGAVPISKLRVDLPYPMASLNKLYPEDRSFRAFVKDTPVKGLIWSDKLDGVSCLAVYNDGKVMGLYTRGDGLVGGNVSYLIEYLGKSLPEIEYKGTFAVRGEFIIKKSVFHAKYRDIYSTARSFIVAQVNKGFVTPSVGDIDIVMYETVNYGGTSEVDSITALGFLETNDFKVVSYGFFDKDVKAMDITLKYKDRRDTGEYNIDGLVLDYNFKRKVKSLNINPEFKVAFKMTFEDQLRDTEVRDVDWDISRHGRYNPVAVYKYVYINHVRMSRATAHNAAHVRDWSMGVGTQIRVVRAGDVIPQIKDVTVNLDIEPIFPSNEYDWSWSSRDIVLDDIEGNKRVHEKRNLHFFQTLNVSGIGEKTIEKLYDAGFKTIKQIIDASPDELTKVRGIGKLTSVKMKEKINKAINTSPIDRFLAALTVTRFKISRMLVKEVLRTYPGILDEPKTPKEIETILKKRKIKGIGPKRNEMIAEQFPLFREMLMDLDKDGVTKAMKYNKELSAKLEKTGYNKNIKGKTFVFTGYGSNKPYDLEDEIFNNFGNISGSVVSGIDAVISKTSTYITPKVLAAKEFGIPIYIESEFREQFLGSNE